MTENEAINAIRLQGGIEITGSAKRVAEFFEGLDIAIQALEKQISENNDGWIPCSERLPEPKTEVICCYDNGQIDMMYQDWKSRGKSGLIYGDMDGKIYKVVAWRPLPDPYHSNTERKDENERNQKHC